MKKEIKQLNLADNGFSYQKKVSRKTEKLLKIKAFVDWDKLVTKINIVDKTNNGKGGRPPYPVDMMLRIIFLQNLFNLDDPDMEDNLIDISSFRAFVGLHSGMQIPDFTTIWRFREKLVKNKLNNVLFDTIYKQIERLGIVLKKGVIMDATIIQSSNRPLSKEKRKELAQNPSNQIDTDATSTEKRKKKYFGYKGHIGVDVGSKIIRKRTFTKASVDDRAEFLNLQVGDEKSVFGDKGYPDETMKNIYRALGKFWGILDKAYKNRPLSNKQKKRNKKLSKVRAGVEHPFAYIKERLGYKKAPYKNKKRNEFKFDMCCILYNINRTQFLLKKKAG